LHPLSGVEHLLLLFVAGALAARLSTLVLRVLGALFIGALGASASAHLGTDSGAWTFIAGFLFTSTSLVAATATAIKLATRQLTAASRRSPT
jgi:hydrogenase/urease accessory protein HupE